MENNLSNKITEYNRIVDFICSLDNFTLEELEQKLGIYLEGLGLDYKKLDAFILNTILHLVFSDRLKINNNKFINNHNNKTIEEKDKLRLLMILENLGDDIYLNNNNEASFKYNINHKKSK